MSSNKRQLLAIAVIGTVFLVNFFSERVNLFLLNDRGVPHFYLSISGQVLYYLVPTIAVLLLFHKPAQIPVETGLGKDFLKGLQYAFIFTLPMLVGYALLGHYNSSHSLIKNILFAFKDGFREEVFYRAFLFGQLFRQVKWGFLPAVGINGLIFGFSHLYQARNLAESVGIVTVTFAGAVWFAWLFIEWKANLWLPVFLHFFMNFYWDLFSTEQSALGGFALNLPRILTIALSVYLTLKIVRKSGQPAINRYNLLKQTI